MRQSASPNDDCIKPNLIQSVNVVLPPMAVTVLRRSMKAGLLLACFLRLSSMKFQGVLGLKMDFLTKPVVDRESSVGESDLHLMAQSSLSIAP